MTIVQWALMIWLLHLVQQRGTRCVSMLLSLLFVVSNITNSPLIKTPCTNYIYYIPEMRD